MSLAAQEMNNDNFCTSSVCVEVVKVVGSGGGKGVSVLVCIPTSGGTWRTLTDLEDPQPILARSEPSVSSCSLKGVARKRQTQLKA